MRRSVSGDVDRLMRAVQQGLHDELEPRELMPLLARLARAAAVDSEPWIFAHRHLAELGVEHDPWRASLFARRVLRHHPEDDGAWAVLGLAQSLLGHCRFAVQAYREALTIAPENPWYAHNLGHLYDVALGEPETALPLLARATAAQPEEPEIASSYAHALARAGRVKLAKQIVRRAMRHGATAEQASLARWIDTLDDDASAEADDTSSPTQTCEIIRLTGDEDPARARPTRTRSSRRLRETRD